MRENFLCLFFAVAADADAAASGASSFIPPGTNKNVPLRAYTLTQAFSEISGIITMFYVVRALSPYTEYEFYVIAVNNIGRGPPSIPATTTTGETGKKQTFK